MPTKKVTTQSTDTKKTSATKKTASPEKAVEMVAAVKPRAEQKAAAMPVAPASGKKTATPVTAEAASAKPAAAKPETAKKPAAKKKETPVHVTTIIARVDVGYHGGGTLFIRGEGAGLSWTAGVSMENTAGDEWSWSTPAATEALTFKFLINDEIWSAGDNFTVAAGETFVSTPTF